MPLDRRRLDRLPERLACYRDLLLALAGLRLGLPPPRSWADPPQTPIPPNHPESAHGPLSPCKRS